jgi:hypothetical protein
LGHSYTLVDIIENTFGDKFLKLRNCLTTMKVIKENFSQYNKNIDGFEYLPFIDLFKYFEIFSIVVFEKRNDLYFDKSIDINKNDSYSESLSVLKIDNIHSKDRVQVLINIITESYSQSDFIGSYLLPVIVVIFFLLKTKKFKFLI